MGLRIHKDIGYFVSKENANKIFVKNYRKIIEQLYENKNKQTQFLNSLMTVMSEVLPPKVSKALTQYQIKELLEQIEKKEIYFHQIINEIYFGDDYEGLLLATPGEIKDSRKDNSIDYYEARQKPELFNEINYLEIPIYPTAGYIYHGGLTGNNAPIEEVGEIVNQDFILYALEINEKFYDNKLDLDADMPKLLTEKGFFTPNIPLLIFVLGKAAGIIKKGISLLEFNKTMKPAILTYWL